MRIILQPTGKSTGAQCTRNFDQIKSDTWLIIGKSMVCLYFTSFNSWWKSMSKLLHSWYFWFQNFAGISIFLDHQMSSINNSIIRLWPTQYVDLISLNLLESCIFLRFNSLINISSGELEITHYEMRSNINWTQCSLVLGIDKRVYRLVLSNL